MNTQSLLHTIDNKVHRLQELRQRIASKTTVADDFDQLLDLISINDQPRFSSRSSNTSPAPPPIKKATFEEVFVPRFESSSSSPVVFLKVLTFSKKDLKKQKRDEPVKGNDVILSVAEQGEIRICTKEGRPLAVGTIQMPSLDVKVVAVAVYADKEAHIVVSLTNNDVVVVPFHVQMRGRTISGRRPRELKESTEPMDAIDASDVTDAIDASDATDATDASGIDCPEIANLPISMEDMKNRASSATTKIKSDIMENMKMMDMIRSRVDADRIKLATQSSAPTQPQSQSPPSIFDVITGLMGENGRLALERLESLPKKNAEQHINTIKSDIVTIAELFPPNPITGLISSTWR